MSEDRNKNMNVFNLDFSARNSQNFPINNLNFNHAFSNMTNMAHNFNPANYTNQLMNGKRNREEIKERSNVQNFNQMENLMASNVSNATNSNRRQRADSDFGQGNNSLSSPKSPPQGSHNKQVLVRKIIENLKKLNTLEESKDNLELKTVSENLKKFSIDDYSKFFQVMSNMQHISHFETDGANGTNKKSKDVISINEKYINYNSDSIEMCLNEEETSNVNKRDFNINKLILRKEITLKNLLKEKFTSLMLNSNETTTNQSQISQTPISSQSIEKISLNSFYEDLLKSIKKDKINDNHQIQNMIRIHSQYVYTNGIIKFDIEDKLFLDFIIENFLSKEQISNFYHLCRFWLLEDFLNYEKDLPLIYLDEHPHSLQENMNIASSQLRRRYDSVLSEILNRIQTHKDLFELSHWIEFIENLPRINHRVIDHILFVHDEIFTNDYEEIIKKCMSKKPLTETLPHLGLIKNIYQKIKKPSNSSNKILSKIIEVQKFPDSHLITQSINFLIDTFYSAGKYEMEKIKEHAINQFRELLKINEKTPNPESFIKSRFPLFFRLIRRDKELFLELPDVYSDSLQIVRNTLDKYLPRVLEVIDTYHAEKLISKCGEKCLKIVTEICEGHLFKPENFTSRKITEDKLFRKIKNYYHDYDTSSENIILALADKIPIGEFYTKENYIWEKIKQFDNEGKHEEILMKIFNKINSIKSEDIYSYKDFSKISGSDPEKKFPNFSSFSDKVMLHILFYIIFNNIKLPNTNETFNFNHFKNELSILLKYYKLIGSEKEVENFKELFNHLETGRILKKNDNLEIILLMRIVDAIFDNFYTEASTVTLELSVGMNAVIIIFIEFLRDYLNSNANLQKENFVLPDNVINELIALIKKLPEVSKTTLLKNLNEKLKNIIRTKDFILFSDI